MDVGVKGVVQPRERIELAVHYRHAPAHIIAHQTTAQPAHDTHRQTELEEMQKDLAIEIAQGLECADNRALLFGKSGQKHV